MQNNLVIVESPAKAKTIEKFLGKDYKVLSSYGHIRDLKKSGLSIDESTMIPKYEIPKEKEEQVKTLREAAGKAKKVWLASDEDREGEAIAWHLCEVLGLDQEKTSRIVFHEITQDAILKAIENPRHIDINLVNAQQTRRVLDRLVGFKISPVLWRKIKPSLSAGRVQSVAVRLLVEREREIQNFKSESYFRLTAVFTIDGTEIKAEANRRLDAAEAKMFIEQCKNATFQITHIEKKNIKRVPAAPFTTSTLQQEAAYKLGMTVAQTMRIAQSLYESGKITYMRTDSVNLSSLCIGASKEEVIQSFGPEYSHPRNFQTSSKGAQEAHEAIRPTYMNKVKISGNPQEKRLYELIWKRTLASQMAEAELEKTTVTINAFNESGPISDDISFIANMEIIKFDGFMKVYRESGEENDDNLVETFEDVPLSLSKGQMLKHKEVVATERYTTPPFSYTEATLVKKLEELGIGRPSTYAPIISTIQQRDYVSREDRMGNEHRITTIKLKGSTIFETNKKERFGNEKKKLIPTDIGIVVNDFLMEFFPNIMDYNFTASVETQFDSIAAGKSKWDTMLKNFAKSFEGELNTALTKNTKHKVGERELGTDPQSGKKVVVKIGRFGPVAQIGTVDDEEKPRFAKIPKELSIENITIEEVMELFKLPRTVGVFEDKEIIIGTSHFGAYVLHNKQYFTIPKSEDPLNFTYEKALNLIQMKRLQERKKVLKTFPEREDMQLLNGRYGIYLAVGDKNYHLTKTQQRNAEKLTYEDCMKVIQSAKK
ncbi:MAG: type I DNA topoisomerase [Bacteroidaceae bacterium]|nr:type I DNA topoisomerase [Bacteroidaceae bacterium]